LLGIEQDALVDEFRELANWCGARIAALGRDIEWTMLVLCYDDQMCSDRTKMSFIN
jgi:hypothetical protein